MYSNTVRSSILTRILKHVSPESLCYNSDPSSSRKSISSCLRSFTTDVSSSPRSVKRSSSTNKVRVNSELKAFSEIPTANRASPTAREDESVVYRELLREYGPVFRIREKDHTTWRVVTHGPHPARATYSAEGRYPSQGRLLTEVMEHLHNENCRWLPSMAFANGDDWRRIRHAARKQAMPIWADQLLEPLCCSAGGLLKHLNVLKADSTGRVDDIRPALEKWAFQGTALFVLGKMVDMYNNINHTHQEFMKAGLEFTRSLRTVTTTHNGYRAFLDNSDELRRLGRGIIKRRHQRVDKGANTTGKASSGVFEDWIERGVFSAEEAAVLCTDLLATSFDAIANTATFLLHELAKQPHLQEQLLVEITTNRPLEPIVHGVQKRDRFPLTPRGHPFSNTEQLLTHEQLQELKLLRQCVRETLRLYPPMAVLKREIALDTVIGGYHIPSGTNVHVTMGLMSHDSALFNQPMKFKPERWEDKNTIQPFSCLPFGFGARACYGRHLAEAQLHTLLYVLIPRYKLITQQEQVAVKYCSGLIATEPVSLTLEAR